jgi:hypothetical protein
MVRNLLFRVALALVARKISVALWPDAWFFAGNAFTLDGGVFPVQVFRRAAPVTVRCAIRPAVRLPKLVRALPYAPLPVAARGSSPAAIGIGYIPVTSRRLISRSLVRLFLSLFRRSLVCGTRITAVTRSLRLIGMFRVVDHFLSFFASKSPVYALT